MKFWIFSRSLALSWAVLPLLGQALAPPGVGIAAAVATDPETPQEEVGGHGQRGGPLSARLARCWLLAAPGVTQPCDHTLVSPCVWVSSLQNTCTQVTSGQNTSALVPTSQAGRPRPCSAQAETPSLFLSDLLPGPRLRLPDTPRMCLPPQPCPSHHGLAWGTPATFCLAPPGSCETVPPPVPSPGSRSF